jgi:SAM-dependent methyltransferase
MRQVLPISDGRRFTLHAPVSATLTETGYLVVGLDRCHLISADLEGCISAEAAERLEVLGLGSSHPFSMFDDPTLLKALFNWDNYDELAGLEATLSSFIDRRGLDVGCAYGRLLLPLIQRGLLLDGVDASLPLLEALIVSLVKEGTHSRVFCSPIETFVSPGAYHFAFAAMNTLRYLETKRALREHLASMAQNIVEGGLYLICLSVTTDPKQHWTREWEFFWKGELHQVRWHHAIYFHLADQTLERIELIRLTTGERVHEEYQRQANYTVSFLRSLCEAPPWQIEQVTDTSFRPVTLNNHLNGTFWFYLRRI